MNEKINITDFFKPGAVDFCKEAPVSKNGGILTMAFVDMQPIESVYSPEEALMCGTLFPNINKPFLRGAEK